MAVRYSADTEVRLGYDPRRGVFRGTVRDPKRRWTGEVRVRSQRTPSSEDYDEAAKVMILRAEREVGRFDYERVGGRPKVRRVFQAPCPKGMKA